jgi:hypothetical protein
MIFASSAPPIRHAECGPPAKIPQTCAGGLFYTALSLGPSNSVNASRARGPGAHLLFRQAPGATPCGRRRGTAFFSSALWAPGGFQGADYENRNCPSRACFLHCWPGICRNDGPARTPRERNSRTTRSILLRTRPSEEAPTHAKCWSSSAGPSQILTPQPSDLNAGQAAPGRA